MKSSSSCAPDSISSITPSSSVERKMCLLAPYSSTSLVAADKYSDQGWRLVVVVVVVVAAVVVVVVVVVVAVEVVAGGGGRRGGGGGGRE